MKEWFKQLFCRHVWKHITDIEFFMPAGYHYEELHECEKCGKLRQRPIK